jgi:L-threonine kinase
MIDGIPFHISCPVDLYCQAEVELNGAGRGLVAPAGRDKALAALQATIQFAKAEVVTARLSIDSPLTPGKGMGSSTADVVATIYATSAALGISFSPEEVAVLALPIDPVDGSVFPGIVRYDHVGGRTFEVIGDPRPLEFVVLDFGGTVDTIEFERVDRSALSRSLEPRFLEAIGLVRAGFAEGDALLIGRGATLSALTNQSVLFKPQLDMVRRLAAEAGALGVNVAHSGTVIGVMLDPRRSEARTTEEYLRARLPSLAWSTTCRLVGGGVRWQNVAEGGRAGLAGLKGHSSDM